MNHLAGFDWGQTPLGPKAGWSPALRTTYDIVMSSGFAMCATWGPDRTIFYNLAYARFLGARHPHALGQPIHQVWHDIWNDIAPLVDRAMAGETVTLEDMYLSMTRYGYGEDTYWTFSYSPLRDGAAIVGFLNVATETTAMLAAQARDRVNAERIQLALGAGAIIGTWFWDLPTDRFTVDAAFARSFGLDPALGHSGIPLEQIIATVHPDDRDSLIAAIEAVIARGGAYAHQYRVRRHDGIYYWIEANGRVDKAEDGTPSRFPGVLIDVDERRAVEAERDRAISMLRTLNDELEQRVSARTAELLKVEDALRQSQKVEAIGQLTGGVAHDFNNLLTVIRGSVDLLRRPDVSDSRRQRYIDAISDTTDRATRLTGQLLAFARRQSLTPEIFDAAASVRAIADMVRTLSGSRIRVSLRLPTEPCFVNADRSQFDTAIVNIAVNARDAMHGEGELTITVEAVSGMPAIRSHPFVPGAFVAVSLTDTGGGIPADMLDNIFEPFFTTKSVGEGTGLGLSQVFGFTKQSGGDIFADSRAGAGATFTMYLPRVEGHAGGLVETDEDAIPLGDGARVLVVEDNGEVGRFATQALAELGYETVLATDGAKALAELATGVERFDVVFSDVMMPGMSGVELGQQIARLYPMLPVVLTSGYSAVLAQNGTHGFDLLHKPYSVDALSRALRKVSRRR